MRNVFYVQRLQKPIGRSNPFSFGGGYKNGGISDEAMNLFNDIFSFDYMGAAEFEFGAVPKAFEAIYNNKSMISFTIEESDKPIYVICPFEIKEEVATWILLAIKGKVSYLKEPLNFNVSTSANDVLGWLKIETEDECKEPFMFFVDKEMFEKTCKLFAIDKKL